MIQDHDPGDEDREVVPTLSTAALAALVREVVERVKNEPAHQARLARFSPQQPTADELLRLYR